MAETYTNHFGIDFLGLPGGVPFPKINAALTIFKKWRQLAEIGLKPDCDPADCTLFAARYLLGDTLKITPWTEQMLRDVTHHKEVIFIGPASSGKSHVLALVSLMMYLCDTLNTACIMCSTTKEDLEKRAWAPLKEMVAQLRNSETFDCSSIQAMQGEYCVCNVLNPKIPETSTRRASIKGVALEENRIQGQHVSGVGSTTLLAIDELSTIKNLSALKTGIMNISAGTDYRFVAAANPDSWSSDISAEFLLPDGGPGVVTPSTGCWTSRSGYFIRHFDGEKSPAILQPEMAAEWHFLLNAAAQQRSLSRCNGDRQAADYMKMVRGWPASGAAGELTVLDPVAAGHARPTDPMPNPLSGTRSLAGIAGGVDPAWTPTGDSAVQATCRVWSQDGRAYLDFTGGVRNLVIVSSETWPALAQMRDGVIKNMQADGGPKIRNLAVDTSGNQSLGAELTTYVGPGCLSVNSSVVASDSFLRHGEEDKNRKARAFVADRGTEAWMVLAEFVRAGQVKGLPQTVVNDLCNRRFASGAAGADLVKSKLEPKEVYGKRLGKGSPNETDACALAALAAKERLGVMPFGAVPPPDPEAVIPQAYGGQGSAPAPVDLSDDSGGGDGLDDIESFED